MKKNALTLTELLVIVAGITLIMLILLPILARMRRPRRSIAYRMTCGTNLSGIGKAMLIYANDYEDELPRAGARDSKWGTTPNYQADNRLAAFGLDTRGSEGSVSISSSLYLLVKYVEVTPKSFVCTNDTKTTEFIPAKYGVRNKELIELWDFGPDPSKHVSYSYHIPYGPYALTTSSDPRVAVAADRNPWMPPNRRPGTDWNSFNPAGDRESVKTGNAITHQQDGQNVLYMDCHVTFERRSLCAFNDDNIYTCWNGRDIQRGTRPKLGSQPADKLDSLLVHDPPTGVGK